ncbi:protein CutA isoform X3 [Ahaetulla prasina]|uniref:protein CutA isoform X3 n=1 Tax=Ahaetulla prasina TaxID=499056 RepID=UPI0026474A9E|nr:protein CutA isoform X3 [Ahaetulla prasina]
MHPPHFRLTAQPRGGRDRKQVAALLLALLMVSALQRLSGRLFSASSSSSMAAEPPSSPPGTGLLSAAFVTCPNETVAKDIARALVERRLAACVNVLPHVTSIYRWKGAVEEDAEVLLVGAPLRSGRGDLRPHPAGKPPVLAMGGRGRGPGVMGP